MNPSAGARVRAVATSFVVVVAMAAGCTASPEADVPVRRAPPSRHASLVDALTVEARAFDFASGDWDYDSGDAAFYGLAWLSHRVASGQADAVDVAQRDEALSRARRLLEGDPFDLTDGAAKGDPRGGRDDASLDERIMAALGVIAYVGASGDRASVEVLDAFVDRLDAFVRSNLDDVDVEAEQSGVARFYGPTVATALVALVLTEYALHVGGPRADERAARALALDAALRERALTDLGDVATGQRVRGYAFSPDQPGLVDSPNIAMLLLKARLFRLTKREEFRLEARSLYVALRALRLGGVPVRYSSPFTRSTLGVDTRDVASLASQNYVTLALLFLFEITGEERFVEEADLLLDGVAAMRGPWCIRDVHDASTCAARCVEGEVCRAQRCGSDRCTEGLLHHVVDGQLAPAGAGPLFCAGCNLQTLFVATYRRVLAGEP